MLHPNEMRLVGGSPGEKHGRRLRPAPGQRLRQDEASGLPSWRQCCSRIRMDLEGGQDDVEGAQVGQDREQLAAAKEAPEVEHTAEGVPFNARSPGDGGDRGTPLEYEPPQRD